MNMSQKPINTAGIEFNRQSAETPNETNTSSPVSIESGSSESGNPNFHDLLGREWDDISSEESRCYEFGGGRGQVTIEAPKLIHVSKSGGHRILDSNGRSYYVPTGWICLSWKGSPPFVK